MLEAIADFWKPVKRLQAQARLRVEELQIGSSVAFGFVPQPTLSGRRFTVTAINTYRFGNDILTSFVLSQEKDAGVSMIIAETGGEQYIAVSRRILAADRGKLFRSADIEAAISVDACQGIECKDITPDYRHWVAARYQRELYKVKGQLYRGDYRGGLMSDQPALDFAYTLLVSENNEHALEIEKYDDGRVEVYATVYRRMSDVNEVTHPVVREISRPEVKLVSGSDVVVDAHAKQEPKMEAMAAPQAAIVEETKTEIPEPVVHASAVVDVQEHIATRPIELPGFAEEDVVKKYDEPAVDEVSTRAKVARAESPAATSVTVSPSSTSQEAPAAIKIQTHSQPFIQQETKVMSKEPSQFVNESIDCELQVANKIIDEAIRSEMRINDVVRRVIGLPVAQQESVQIPVTLSDQDYALLAIRYGMNSGDHDAIKRRITEDLADFSGASRKMAA